MAQEEFDPLDLLSKVAMLVLEARTPHPSAKGRVEGPHCSTPAEQRGQHLCCPEKPECAQAQEVRERIEAMWRNGIPSCMDILLFPDCSHGRAETRSLDGATDFEENALLLERWSIKCTKKWHGEWTEGVVGSMLLQAVRSFLYFSQLSSWLASMHGHLPGQIAYRLYAPGDCGDVDFTSPPQTHVFPSAIYGPHGVKATVLHLPRLDQFPKLRCALQDPGVWMGEALGWQVPKEREREGAAEEEARSKGVVRKKGGAVWYSKPSGSAQNSVRLASDKRRPPQDQQRPSQDSTRPFPNSKQPIQCRSSASSSATLLLSPRDLQPCPSKHLHPWISDAADPRNRERSQGQGDPQEKVKDKKQSARESLESQLRPLELVPSTAAQSLDLHSPKVLMSDVFYNPAPATCRLQLDFSSHPCPQPCPPGSGQRPNDKAFLMQRFGQAPTTGLLPPHLELSTLLYNLQSFAGPIPAHSLDPTHRPLSYKLSGDKAGRLEMGTPHWDWNQVQQTPVRRREGGEVEPGRARFYKKALQYGQDSSASAQASSSASSTEPAPRPHCKQTAASIPGEPRKLSEQPSFSGERSRSVSTNALKRTSPELPTRKIKIKKREGAGTSGSVDNGAGLTESRSSPEIQNSGEARVSSPHSTPSSASKSVSQTLKDLGKSVQPQTSHTVQSPSGQLRPHQFLEPLSDSWSSSSSSSSSSTYSSSPKVSTEGRDRHSDSSTPTNLSTSPLLEEQQSVSHAVKQDQQSASCHDRPAPATATARDAATEQDSSSTPGVCEPLLTDVSKKTSKIGSWQCDAQKDQELLDGTETVLPSSLHRRSSDPEIVKCLEQYHRQSCEGSSRSSSLHSSPRSLSPCDELHAASPTRGRDCVPSSLSSNIKSVGNWDSNVDQAKSPCRFYLESPTSGENILPAVCQWQSVLDTDRGDCKELTSRLEQLCLQHSEQALQSSSCLPEDSVDSRSQPNGCEVDSYTRYLPRSQSNGHAVCDVVQNGSQSCHSAPDSSSSIANQQSRNGCADPQSDCDVTLLMDANTCPGVSIPNSFVVPPRPKVTDQREPCSLSSVEMQFACDSTENTSPRISNGAVDSTRDVAVSLALVNDDGVFYEKSSDAEDSAMPHCPTRTKSAPNFSSLSEKNRMREEERGLSSEEVKRGRSALREKEGVKVAGSDRLRHRLVKSASMLFNSRGSVPSQSSPAPVKRRSTGRFDYDETLTTTKAIKSAISLSRLPDVCKDSSDNLAQAGRVLSTSAPASTNCLLGNFEESILNGRLEPAGVVEGFSIDIGASGKFCPRHVSLPVTAYFFNLSDDNAPSPYLGHINLDSLGKRGYHIPNVGTLQVTLFNPNKTVVKMFVVKYSLQDMPPNSQTVLRQRTVYQPVDPLSDLPSYLRYLIHLRISSSSSGKTYLHTDIRLIFARNKFELDSSEVQYKLCSYTETPINPKYSPKR